MEEQIKTTITSLNSKEKDDDKDTRKYMIFLFLPLITIIVLCFRYNTLRLIVLCLSGVFMCYASYKTYKAKGERLDKEILWQLLLIGCTVIAIFIKFFSDLVLSYITLLFTSILLLFTFKLIDSKQKVYMNYYVFFGSIITALILNYKQILMFIHNIFGLQ